MQLKYLKKLTLINKFGGFVNINYIIDNIESYSILRYNSTCKYRTHCFIISFGLYEAPISFWPY